MPITTKNNVIMYGGITNLAKVKMGVLLMSVFSISLISGNSTGCSMIFWDGIDTTEKSDKFNVTIIETMIT